ncbi:MAG: nicotinate (nicotinamide) nucleotide adenylyltransferase [Pseudohongiellaceae bacterium]
MTDRIGIMGGMFDPPHRGHIRAALAAADALALERVCMVPCARPNHRAGASADGCHRLAMLRLACAEHAVLEVDDRELQRGGTSYTADTLEEFSARYPRALRVFIQGWDSFLTLPGWERWEDILRTSHVCAVSRPGSRLPAGDSDDPAERIMAAILAERRVERPEELLPSTTGGILVLESVDCAISSTQLRQQLQTRGEDGAGTVDQWLTPDVTAYIRTHQLY